MPSSNNELNDIPDLLRLMEIILEKQKELNVYQEGALLGIVIAILFNVHRYSQSNGCHEIIKKDEVEMLTHQFMHYAFEIDAATLIKVANWLQELNVFFDEENKFQSKPPISFKTRDCWTCHRIARISKPMVQGESDIIKQCIELVSTWINIQLVNKNSSPFYSYFCFASIVKLNECIGALPSALIEKYPQIKEALCLNLDPKSYPPALPFNYLLLQEDGRLNLEKYSGFAKNAQYYLSNLFFVKTNLDNNNSQLSYSLKVYSHWKPSLEVQIQATRNFILKNFADLQNTDNFSEQKDYCIAISKALLKINHSIFSSLTQDREIAILLQRLKEASSLSSNWHRETFATQLVDDTVDLVKKDTVENLTKKLSHVPPATNTTFIKFSTNR